MAKTLTFALAVLGSAMVVAQPIAVKLRYTGFSVIDLASTRHLFSDLGFTIFQRAVPPGRLSGSARVAPLSLVNIAIGAKAPEGQRWRSSRPRMPRGT
jgi:hypothetical protein